MHNDDEGYRHDVCTLDTRNQLFYLASLSHSIHHVSHHGRSMKIVDPGFTCHDFADRSMFRILRSTNRTACTMDGQTLNVQSIGTVQLQLDLSGGRILYWSLMSFIILELPIMLCLQDGLIRLGSL